LIENGFNFTCALMLLYMLTLLVSNAVTSCFYRVGIDNPTIEVRFENLNIDAEAYVGNRGIPTFTNFFSNKIMVSSGFTQTWKKISSSSFLRLLTLESWPIPTSGCVECSAHNSKREEAYLHSS
jgi:hypothetical protein